MPFSFPQAERAYRDDRISDLSADAEGMRFLLLRSLSRAEHMDRLAADIGVSLETIPGVSDFFVAMVPFDLKVTYLPEGYLKDRRSAQGLRPELTLLKREARNLGVHFESTLAEARLLELLWTRLSDHPSQSAQTLIRELSEQRSDALHECVSNPDELIRWLYENQGVRRFDALNRLFLVLVNTQNYFASWKLKRAKDLLERDIGRYLDAVQEGHVGRRISFEWEGQQHSAVSDVVFVQHGA